MVVESSEQKSADLPLRGLDVKTPTGRGVRETEFRPPFTGVAWLNATGSDKLVLFLSDVACWSANGVAGEAWAPLDGSDARPVPALGLGIRAQNVA